MNETASLRLAIELLTEAVARLDERVKALEPRRTDTIQPHDVNTDQGVADGG